LVYNRGNVATTANWAQIVYEKIDVQTGIKTRATWGFVGNSHYAYPNICSFGKTATDESAMLSFLRAEPTLYPEVCVVNFDGGFSTSSTVVKQGSGYADLLNSTNERWGDYTNIQRKYNTSTFPVAWLVGSYGYGDSTNNYYGNANGITNGWNAYIAEIGNIGVGLREGYNKTKIKLFPNPTSDVLYIESVDITSIEVNNELGQVIKVNKSLNQTGIIDVKSLNNGLYFIKITTPKNTYYEKFIKN
jgi:hypothetical protein